VQRFSILCCNNLNVFGDEKLLMLGPRVVTIAHPRGLKTSAAALRFPALLGVRIVIDVLVLASTAENPRSLSHDEEELLARTLCLCTTATIPSLALCQRWLCAKI
jgi:hypothetical protein